jgi:hypothetical protein
MPATVASSQRLVRGRLARETGADIRGLLGRQERHTGRAPGAVVSDAVAGRLELAERKRVWLGLRLLEQHDVRLVQLQELEHARHAHLSAS